MDYQQLPLLLSFIVQTFCGKHIYKCIILVSVSDQMFIVNTSEDILNHMIFCVIYQCVIENVEEAPATAEDEAKRRIVDDDKAEKEENEPEEVVVVVVEEEEEEEEKEE